eukprot:220850-Chlamydomonas_euryale.AAC.2
MDGWMGGWMDGWMDGWMGGGRGHPSSDRLGEAVRNARLASDPAMEGKEGCKVCRGEGRRPACRGRGGRPTVQVVLA